MKPINVALIRAGGMANSVHYRTPRIVKLLT